MKKQNIGQVYENLAFELDDGDGGNSLSGYQCINPFVDKLLDNVRRRVENIDFRLYTYFDADEALIDRISAFHCAVDGVKPSTVICGSGATSQIFGFVSYLREKRIQKVFYIPPLYFTQFIALDRFEITAIPIADRQPYEPHFELQLPNEEGCCLLLVDPIWYTGTPLSDEVITELASWQKRTGALIFVDGSLQYMQWQGRTAERSSELEPSLTIRLLCPTKQLALHGYRFSYLLAPEKDERSLAWACATVAGSASAESIAFAHEAMEALDNGAIPHQLMQLASRRHKSLRDRGSIESTIEPQCGYFIFEKINALLPETQVLADGRYFEQSRYPGYFKINLLSPSIDMLD